MKESITLSRRERRKKRRRIYFIYSVCFLIFAYGGARARAAHHRSSISQKSGSVIVIGIPEPSATALLLFGVGTFLFLRKGKSFVGQHAI